MKLKLYAIKDTVVGDYSDTYPYQNDAVAIRHTQWLVNNTEKVKSHCSENQRDKQLWYVAEIDTDTALITNNIPRLVKNLVELIEGKGE